MPSSPLQKILSTLFYLAFFASLAVGGYVYRNEVSFVVKENLWALRPCSFTLTYSLGEVDPRFGISKDDFLTNIETATHIWGDAVNKRLFIYKETGGDITVNLLYDKRQETTAELAQVNTTITAGKTEYENLKAKYSSLLLTYERDKTSVLTQIGSYKSKTNSYNQTVAYWNSQGGAPKKEFGDLAIQKTSLDELASLLQQAERELNKQLPELNQTVKDLNNTIAKYNLSVTTYNAVGSALEDEFDQGEYAQSLGNKSISIYQFESNAKLIRVLAHEFGHALGIDHVQDDTDAIMYYLNQSKNGVLSTSDIDALKNACKIK